MLFDLTREHTLTVGICEQPNSPQIIFAKVEKFSESDFKTAYNLFALMTKENAELPAAPNADDIVQSSVMIDNNGSAKMVSGAGLPQPVSDLRKIVLKYSDPERT